MIFYLNILINSKHFSTYNSLKSMQCNKWFRMFSRGLYGRIETRSEMGKLYGILLYLTEMFSDMNRCNITLKYLVPNLRHCLFKQKRLIVSSSPCTNETPSDITTATRHTARGEVRGRFPKSQVLRTLLTRAYADLTCTWLATACDHKAEDTESKLHHAICVCTHTVQYPPHMNTFK
jgi:hypothetical protein